MNKKVEINNEGKNEKRKGFNSEKILLDTVKIMNHKPKEDKSAEILLTTAKIIGRTLELDKNKK
jgi:hypothetical protein